VTVARAHPDWVRPQDRKQVEEDDFIVWDTALVFAPGARWEGELPRPIFYGQPLVHVLDELRGALAARR
jgi:hypothetical protein